MKLFIRTQEDFTCEHCEAEVKGNGYTNHCPECLWSKHVDVNPGDRSSSCGGMMKPVSIEKKGDAYSVFQECTKCSHVRKNKITPEDNFEVILALS